MNIIKHPNSFERSQRTEYWGQAKNDDGRISVYLRKRGLSGKVPPTLRLNRKATYWKDGLKKEFPAMVAKFTNESGEALGCQVTYLSKSSEGKAKVKPAKKSFRFGDPSLSGTALKLYPFNKDKPLAIAEGIESAIAVYEATQMPIWACGGANFLKNVQIPMNCQSVYIFADLDQNKAGQTSATKLAEKLWAQGIKKLKIVCPTGPIPKDRTSIDFLGVFSSSGKEGIADILKITSNWKPDFGNKMSKFRKSSNLPSIPSKVFPDWLENFIDALSHSTETPRDLAAASVLPVLATCLQRKLIVEIKSDYFEPLNIFTLVSLESGNRKTAVMEKLIAPLKQWDKGRVKIFESELKRKNLENNSTIPILKFLMAPPRLLAQDITPEKLGDLMEQNNEKISIFCDEGGLIDILEGRYTNGRQNLDLVLKSWEGSSYLLDRQTRSANKMDNPALTIGLMPQPYVVKNLIENHNFRKRGLAARFVFFSPTSLLGERSFDTNPIPNEVSSEYNKRITDLIKFKDPGFGKRIGKPLILKLTAGAKRDLKEFFDKVEPELNRGGKFRKMSDWAGKIPGTTARIAGLLHCADQVGSNQFNEYISRKTMMKARQLSEVAFFHALATFGIEGVSNLSDHALKVWHWIEGSKNLEFTGRECNEGVKGFFKKKIVLNKVLEELLLEGTIKRSDVKTLNKRGRPSEHFVVVTDRRTLK